MVTSARGCVADAVLIVIRSAKLDIADFFGGADVGELAARVRSLATLPAGGRGDRQVIADATCTELWILAESVLCCLERASDPHGHSGVDDLCTDALIGDEDVNKGLYEIAWRLASPASLKTWFIGSVCGFDGLLQSHLARRWKVCGESAEGATFSVGLFTNRTPVKKVHLGTAVQPPLERKVPRGPPCRVTP